MKSAQEIKKTKKQKGTHRRETGKKSILDSYTIPDSDQPAELMTLYGHSLMKQDSMKDRFGAKIPKKGSKIETERF